MTYGDFTKTSGRCTVMKVVLLRMDYLTSIPFVKGGCSNMISVICLIGFDLVEMDKLQSLLAKTRVFTVHSPNISQQDQAIEIQIWFPNIFHHISIY